MFLIPADPAAPYTQAFFTNLLEHRDIGPTTVSTEVLLICVELFEDHY